eukprot:9491693-Pyramimonas_sp.AAC.1
MAERTPGNIGALFNRGHRSDVFHGGTHAGRPVSTTWDGDLQPNEATALLRQQGGQPAGSQDSWAPGHWPSATVALAQAITLVGSAGQPAESDFDPGTDADI